MTDQEKEIVKDLNHPLYTVEYLEEWIDRNDSVSVNALQAVGARGYYEAVRRMATNKKEPPQMTGREAVAMLFR